MHPECTQMHPECILSVSNCILSVSILSVFPRNEYVVAVPDVLLSFTSLSSVLPPILTLTAGDMNSVQLCSKHNHQYLIFLTKTSVQKLFLPVNSRKKDEWMLFVSYLRRCPDLFGINFF